MYVFRWYSSYNSMESVYEARHGLMKMTMNKVSAAPSRKSKEAWNAFQRIIAEIRNA